jgi:hypothetical protein
MSYSVSDLGFIDFVKRQSVPELTSTIDKFYSGFCNSFKTEPSFGSSGSKEFVASILLLMFDEGTKVYIANGLQQVFENKWGPLDFSDFIDKVVRDKSVISYNCWSEVYRYLEKNHVWIEVHPCATGKTKLSSANPIKSLFKR